MEIIKDTNYLILKYVIDVNYYFQNRNWIDENIEQNRSFKIAKIFELNRAKLIQLNSDQTSKDFDGDYKEYNFIIGNRIGKWFKLDNEVLDLKYNCHISTEADIVVDYFLTGTNINIIQKISNLISTELYIGPNEDSNLVLEEFENLINLFPTAYEIGLYRDARVTSVLRNYFDYVPDKKQQYENYLNKKIEVNQLATEKLKNIVRETETLKYQAILQTLKQMLEHENEYSENDWQNHIVDLITILFPKYIKVIKELKFKDINNKNRRLDFGLIDFDGNLDILEIKKSANIDILAKGLYRDNFIANRDLIGSVMQIEKYIYYLNKGGHLLSNRLNDKYSNELGLEINITNPKGIILLGRSNNLTRFQKNDFELIKRKYNNIVDILTYDNLIERVEKIINSFK